MFRDWIFRNFQLAPRDNAIRVKLRMEMFEYTTRNASDASGTS